MNLSVDLIPISDANIASMHAHVDIPQIICDDCTTIFAYCVDSSKFPIIHANTSVNIPRLIVCPIVLIVACDADAVGASFGGTELIIAFMFGDVNSPIPIPCKIIASITK